jgi:hypothetical protein
VVVHKVRTGLLCLPAEERRKSREWLEERGYRAIDATYTTADNSKVNVYESPFSCPCVLNCRVGEEWSNMSMRDRACYELPGAWMAR